VSYIKRIATAGITLFVVVIVGSWAYISYQFNCLAWDLVKVSESLPHQSKIFLSQVVDYKSVEVHPYFLRIDFKGLRIRLDWKSFREDLFPLKTDSQDIIDSTVDIQEKVEPLEKLGFDWKPFEQKLEKLFPLIADPQDTNALIEAIVEKLGFDWRAFEQKIKELSPLVDGYQNVNASIGEMLEKLGLGKEVEIIGNVRLQYNPVTNRTEILTSETIGMVKLSDGRVLELSSQSQSWKTEIQHGSYRALFKKNLKEALKAGAVTGISCFIDNHTTFLKGSDVPLYKIEHGEVAIHFDAFTSPQRINISATNHMKNADYSGFKQLPGAIWEQVALYGVSNNDFKLTIDVHTHESIAKILEKIKEVKDLGEEEKKQPSDIGALVSSLKHMAVSYRTQGEDAVESKAGRADMVLDMSQKFLKVTLDLNTKPLQNTEAIVNARIKLYELTTEEDDKEHPTDKQLLRDFLKLVNELLSQYCIKFDGSCNWQKGELIRKRVTKCL